MATDINQSEQPFWKRHFRLLAGGGTITVVAIAVVIGVVISNQNKGNEKGEGNGNPASASASNPSPTVQPSNAPTSPLTQSPAYHASFDLYSWGNPWHFGVDSDDSFTTPTFMNETVIDASAGRFHSMIVLPNGTARSAGYRGGGYKGDAYYFGWLGVLNVPYGNRYLDIDQVVDTESGVIVKAPPFKRVFAGESHSVLIDKDGQAWTTGWNIDGQLCLGDDENRMIPHKVQIEGRIVDAAVGGFHTLLLHENGTVFGCGSNASGQLGKLGSSGDVQSVSTPTKIEGLGFVESISAGNEYSLFRSSTGLHVSGRNDEGQLCVDTGKERAQLTLLDINQDEVVSFQGSYLSSYILFTNGTVVACGNNQYGELGDGTNYPKIRTTSLTSSPIKQLAAGNEYAVFIGDDDDVSASGLNSDGQLGVGDEDNRNIPSAVQFGEDVVVEHISAGHEHTVAMVKKREN